MLDHMGTLQRPLGTEGEGEGEGEMIVARAVASTFKVVRSMGVV